MIDALLATPTVEESPSHEPEFRVNSPAANPFVTPGPINIVRSDDHFEIEWGDEEFFATQAAAEFAEDVLLRSSRDVERHLSSPRARTNLGVALMNAGRIDEAVREFEAALEIDPTHYPALAHLARAKFLEGRLEEAQRLANELRRRFPNDAVAPMMLACLAIRRDESDMAIAELRNAAKLDPRSPLPRYLLGMVFLSVRREQDAITCLKAATRLDDRSPVLQRSLGVAYAAHGDLVRAIRAFKTSLILDPNAVETVHALARVMMRHGDTESAVEMLLDHVSRHGNDRVAQELLAQAYRKQEQYRAVKRHLLRALNSLEGDHSPEAAAERARLMNNIGAACASFSEFEEAEQWFVRSLAVAPDPIAFQNLYGVHQEHGDLVSGRSVLNRWLHSFPDDRDAQLLSAINRTETGDRERGMRELRALVESGVAAPRVYAALGWLLSDHERDLDAALAILMAGFERFPTETAIVNNLAYVHLMRGEPERARKALETVNPEKVAPSIYLTATWGLLQLWEGNTPAAIQQYRMAEEMAKRNGRPRLARRVRQKMHLELARHYLRLGEPQRAAVEIKQGLANGGDREYRDDLRKLRERLLTA